MNCVKQSERLPLQDVRAHAGVWGISQRLRENIGNDSGKLRRSVRAIEEERDVQSVFFFFVIPTLKHIRN